MTGSFDDSTDWRDFQTLDDYIDYRLDEALAAMGEDRQSFSDETMKDWAEIFIDQHDWEHLQEWMDWTDDEMADFFDWWREMYENA